MKKNIMIVMILILGFCCFKLNTYAEVCDTSSDSCSTMISNYNSGKTQKIKITSGTTGNNNATVYGKSVCSGSKCTIDYSGFSSYSELLKNNVVCSNGEKYIKIQSGDSDAPSYTDPSNGSNKEGTYYFSEKYSVTCTGEVTSGNVELSSSSTTSTNSSSTSSNSSSASTTNTSNSGSGVENPGTGVETYYIILGVVAIGAYLITINVKKHNLFKNI